MPRMSMALLCPRATITLLLTGLTLSTFTHGVLTAESSSGVKEEPKPSAVKVETEKVESPQSWNSWTPVSPNSSFWLPPPNTTPLSPTQSSYQPPLPPTHQYSHYNKPTKKHKKRGSEKEVYTLEGLRSRAMSYGKMMLGLLGGSRVEAFDEFLPAATSAYESWSSSGTGESGGEGGRSALGWLSRLIGVEGKSLGEFLREYQVHVLYDLAFTFFKWVFFLYAGLLIP